MIDFLLDHYGTLKRQAIIDYFGISPAQVTRDLRKYLQVAPNNAVFDPKAGAYLRGVNFARVWA